MPVTVEPCDVQVNFVSIRNAVQEPLDLLEGACKEEYQKCSKLLQYSFSGFAQTIKPSSNGFVRGAVEAYNNHHHLQLRPEDIWFAILSQISIYINHNPDEMRGKFVAHEGKKELVMITDEIHHHGIDFGPFAEFMSNEIEKYVVDPGLKDWVMPEFTTTTEQDMIVASVLLMGSLKEYFGYKCDMRCGLPSVTLLGERTDWEEILRRLDKLKEFGDEPTQFCALLRPVITRFILSFDDPDSNEVRRFWNRIAHKCELQSGPTFYSGWISAFCFWNLDGKIEHLKHNTNVEAEFSRGRTQNPQEPLSLDGVVYHAINSNNFPPGYSSVTIKIDVNREIVYALMVAGSVGLNCTKSTVMQQHEDTISAETGWWIFEKKDDDDTTK